MRVFNDRGELLFMYMIAVLLLLLGIPAISNDRLVLLGCLLTFPLVLFIPALLLTRRSPEDRQNLLFVHIGLMLKVAVALIAVRIMLWLAGYPTLSSIIERS